LKAHTRADTAKKSRQKISAQNPKSPCNLHAGASNKNFAAPDADNRRKVKVPLAERRRPEAAHEPAQRLSAPQCRRSRPWPPQGPCPRFRISIFFSRRRQAWLYCKERCRPPGALPSRMRDRGGDSVPPDVRFAGKTCVDGSSALVNRPTAPQCRNPRRFKMK